MGLLSKFCVREPIMSHLDNSENCDKSILTKSFIGKNFWRRGTGNVWGLSRMGVVMGVAFCLALDDPMSRPP